MSITTFLFIIYILYLNVFMEIISIRLLLGLALWQIIKTICYYELFLSGFEG